MIDTILEWDGLRWLNLFLSCTSVILICAGAYARWPIMPLPMRRLVPWIIATYAVIAYGSGEALAKDVTPGLRVLLMTLSLIGTGVALVYNLKHGGYEPPPPGYRGFMEPRHHHQPRSDARSQ